MDKTMSLAAVAREIHENAVAHGWWEGEREIDEIYALIHSEWSEALEEARAGRPDRWYGCKIFGESVACSGEEMCSKAIKVNYAHPCLHMTTKPEGMCVELIDGVIRILDYLGHAGGAEEYADGTPDYYFEMYGPEGENWTRKVQALSAGALVKRLHSETAKAGDREPGDAMYADNLLEAATIAWQWIKGRGLDPMELLVNKHEYNATRPYKHGKRF